MQTSLKANLLKHLIAKKEDGGFTLIELLVVIIIIGILSAIALPAFLNQANRARQSEAVTYVGSMNRAQQAYYLERSAFTDGIAALGLGIPDDTQNYGYRPVLGTGDTAFVTNQAIPGGLTDEGDPDPNLDAPVRAYVGGVSIAEVNPQEVTNPDAGQDGQPATITVSETTTVAILCEANFPPVNGGAIGDQQVTATGDGGAPECPGTPQARDGYNRKS